MAIDATADRPTYIDPSRLYSLRGFIRSSGVSYSCIKTSKRHGIELPSIRTGKRVFVRGSDGIAFIERLAAWNQERRAQAQQ